MKETILMPKVKADMTEGAIKKWLKKPGDTVAAGDSLFTVAVGKLVKTVTAESAGVLEEILVKEGEKVPCLTPVATLEATQSAGGEDADVEISMPKVGSAAEGTVKKWFRAVGDAVAPGDMLFSMAAGKLVQNITSPCAGTVKEILAPAGEKAPAGTVVAVLSGSGTVAAAEKKACSIIVIGGGPGGYVAALRAAQLGAKVTLVEKKKVGGTCLNVGCIPTKALLHSAELYYQATHGAQAGVTVEGARLDWEQVQKNRMRVSKTLCDGVEGLLAMAGVEVVPGTARFLSLERIEVTQGKTRQELTADRFIVATGSVPVMPPIPGIAGNADCVDSTGALELSALPKSMVLIGGGVIGVELACAYARFGTEVTIVEMMPRLLPTMDGELTEMAKGYMEQQGIRFSMETKVTAIEKGQGMSIVRGEDKDGNPVEFPAEKILVAVGRRSYCDGLGLEEIGVKCEKGRVVVNDAMATSVPGIYAIGDCNGKLMLAHTASMMGEVAAKNAMGGHETFDGSATPSCVYLFPDFAGVGLTEEQAEKTGRPLEIGRFPMVANGKALIMDSPEGMVKIIADKASGRVLGVHILGAHATDLIAEAALAMHMKATVKDIINTIHAHPTVAESVREAALAADGTPIHIHKD